MDDLNTQNKSKLCPKCKSNLFNGTDMGQELYDREGADATLRICSRLFLSLSTIGGVICFILIASKGGGSQLVLAFLSATAIICMGLIIWAACNVLVNISSNIREMSKKH